jgi:acetyl esterase
MPVHPQAQAIIDELNALNLPPYCETTPEQARRAVVVGSASLAPGEPVEQVTDRRVSGPAGEIPVRVYRPTGQRPRSVLMYFHGGGWVICNLDTHDAISRRLANATGCVVVSVDYRLAPEHKFPAGLGDCYAATVWAAESAAELGADDPRVSVSGDSAGANLATGVAMMARIRARPALAFQLLVYPVTDCRFDTASYNDNADGYLLTREAMQWFWQHYLEDEAQADNPHASPLRAKNLSGLPPAHVITAEYDPLRDEGEAYAARLRDAGVPVTLIRYDGMIHDFFRRFAALDDGARAIEEAAAAMRTVLEEG